MKHYFNQKKILVTGAAGFIGSYICESLVEKGALVTAVVRKKSNIKNLERIRNKIAIKEADLSNQRQVTAFVKKYPIIIHAAAVDGGISFKKKYAGRIFHQNVHISMNIFEALKKGRAEKLLYISSAEVYSNLQNKNGVKEEHMSLFAPQKPEQWYAFSKIISEHTAQLVGKTHGIQIIIARPANIYGPRDDSRKNRLVPTLLEAFKKHKKKLILNGTGKDVRSFMFVTDYVENLLQVLEKSNGGVYNFAGEHATSIENFTKLFSKLSGIKITFKDAKKEVKGQKNRILLDITKAKKTVNIWYDSSYKKRLQELIQQI